MSTEVWRARWSRDMGTVGQAGVVGGMLNDGNSGSTFALHRWRHGWRCVNYCTVPGLDVITGMHAWRHKPTRITVCTDLLPFHANSSATRTSLATLFASSFAGNQDNQTLLCLATRHASNSSTAFAPYGSSPPPVLAAFPPCHFSLFSTLLTTAPP